MYILWMPSGRMSLYALCTLYGMYLLSCAIEDALVAEGVYKLDEEEEVLAGPSEVQQELPGGRVLMGDGSIRRKGDATG